MKKINNKKEKWAKFMNRQFTEKEMKKARENTEGCSVLQAVKQIKPILLSVHQVGKKDWLYSMLVRAWVIPTTNS